MPHDLLAKIKAAARVDLSFANDRLEEGRSWLHEAASVHAPELIEILLASGIGSNGLDDCNRSPLNYIDRLYSDLEESPLTLRSVELLLANGANPNHQAAWGGAILYRMVRCSYSGCVALLEMYGTKVDIRTAILRGDRSAVRAIIERGEVEAGSVHHLARDVLDMTLYASSRTVNQGPIMNLLIDFGLSPNVIIDDQCPVLAAAVCASGDLGLIETLLRRGADVNAICSESGLTALDEAKRYRCHAEIIDALESYGAKG